MNTQGKHYDFPVRATNRKGTSQQERSAMAAEPKQVDEPGDSL